MIKRYFILVATAFALAACGSNVKKDASLDQQASSTAGQGQQGESSVTAVQVQDVAGDRGGPAGVERVVYFAFDSYRVESQYQHVVDQHARYLRDNPNMQVVLEGNTDERGTREYNLALGQKRAEAVGRAMTLVGADGHQVEAVSFGKERPVAHGHNEHAWAQNRRVEFRYQ